MRRLAYTLVLMAGALAAQPTVAPSPEPTGNPRGENTAGYNVRQQFELGYRWNAVDGNRDTYRSMVNFGNGIRLLSNSLSVQSREGHGGLFDQIILNTQGLGNDPYQSANFRIEKNRLYRYDLNWRSMAYFNPGLRAPAGLHAQDSLRHMQDQDLTLFPQGALRFFVGYSRNTQSGPALSTIQLFNSSGDEFPLFANIRRQQNEYRAGFEARALGFRLNVLHSWVNFKEDTPLALGASPGANPNDLVTLSSYRRAEPYHGNSPFWRIGLFRESKLFAVNGRFTYVDGRRNFVNDESAFGTSGRTGIATQRQILAFGDARRPAATGNLTLAFFPLSNLTVTNQTSLYHIRMEGNSSFAQADNGGVLRPVLNLDFLGIRNIANSTDLDFRATRWLALHAGYTFDERRIRSIQDSTTPNVAYKNLTPVEQTNRLHAGVFGVRLKPIKPVTINLDAEIGRADQPFTSISERSYHALRGRFEYKVRNLRFAAFSRTNYNLNSVALSSFASHSRQNGADLSWTARSWLSFDAGYNHQHLDTLGALEYFASLGGRNQVVSGDQSSYVSNIHTASFAARLSFKDRVDLSLGYSHVQDTGDGRGTPTGAAQYSSIAPLQSAQTFPLRYNTPMARVSVSITPKIRWNAGYQFYGYAEQFAGLYPAGLANYRAHTGYTSVAWSF